MKQCQVCLINHHMHMGTYVCSCSVRVPCTLPSLIFIVYNNFNAVVSHRNRIRTTSFHTALSMYVENISSLSGSDSSEDDDDTVRGGPLKDGAGLQGASPTPKRRQQGQAQGSPLLYFRTATDHIYGVYSSVLHHSKVGLL